MAKLGDVFSVIRNGASIRQADGTGGLPITRIETISNRKIDRSKFGYAGIEDADKYLGYILQDMDILMSHINSEKHLGKVALYKKLGNEKIIHGMNLLMLRANKSFVYPPFATYFFETNIFLGQIKKITKKSVNQASFTVTALKEIVMDLPPLDEQRKIAAVLDKVSELIDKRRQQLDKLDLLIKSKFVEMFGDPQTNDNQLPMISLGKLGKWSSGGTPTRTISEYFCGDIDWYSAGELNSLYLDSAVEKITQKAIDKSAAKLFGEGSMLVGMYDTAAFKMGILKKPSASNQACACIEPNERVNIVWLYHTLQLMKDRFLKQRRGVRQKNLNLGMMKSFDIPLADRAQQDKFAAFVDQTEKSKEIIKQSLEKLETLKKALMQEYFG